MLQQASALSAPSLRVRGFDSIRFILACIVAIGHNGLFPLLEGIDTTSRIGWLVKGFYGASINGQAAVIVFFVISGFCIHYPYRNGERLSLLQYYPRRYLRILVPLAGGIAIAHWAGMTMPHFEDSILWSIVCEEIYYLIYPLLLVFRRKFEWTWLLILTFVPAIVVAWSNPSAGNYPSYGWQLNWVLGLPCWLLGCKLAETSDSLRLPVSTRAIWGWRLIVWFTAGALLGLRFHSRVGYPHTLNYFAILSYFWLQREIRYFRDVKPLRLLEWGGKWSYSLYLLHVSANVISHDMDIPNLGFILNWFLHFGSTLGCCYVFYLLVEKPSHSFARWIGKGRSRDVMLTISNQAKGSQEWPKRVQLEEAGNPSAGLAPVQHSGLT
jgi:peptidoglycan/LPS O-acetylase OafA/YrhL